MKRLLSRTAIVIFSLGLLASMIFMAFEIIEKEKQKPSFEASTVEMPSTQVVDQDNRPKAPAKDIDWTGLKKQNEDVYAWISIPGTNIDYPLLQHPSILNYYLDHNLDRSYGYPGCIYTQSLNKKDFTDPNTLIYGHNMRNGTMFKQLRSFEDMNFFNQHQYVYIYSPDKMYTYEVYAAVVYDDRHLLYTYDFNDKAQFNRFIEEIKSSRDMRSHIKSDMAITPEDKLVTLSTCITADGPERWLVICVQRNEEAYCR